MSMWSHSAASSAVIRPPSCLQRKDGKVSLPTDLKTTAIAEFCKDAGIGMTAVYALIADGTLETITIGKRRLIVVESWRQYIANHLSRPADTRRSWIPPRPGPRHASAG
jgi:hypothetical protein